MGEVSLQKKIKIGLLWHSASSANLGVGALTIANLAIAREIAAELDLDPEFLIIGMRDGSADYISRDQVQSYVVDTFSLVNPTGVWAAIRSRDCLLDIGAGDSFAQIYGPKRFLYLWLTKLMANLSRIPLLLSPQTIGPFTSPIYRALARLVLEPASAVVARDPVSLGFLSEIAPKAHGVLSVDVAFALPYVDNSSLRNGTKIRVGVNVSGLLFNAAVSGGNRFGLDINYAKLMRRYIGSLLARSDVEVHLISHVPSGWGHDDDSVLADALAIEFPGVVRAPDFAGPSEAKSYISGMDFVVAGRMHACIAAFSTGVPVVPIAYSRKFSGLFGMLDYPWMVPVNGFGDDGAFAFLYDCLERRSELATATRQGMSKVQALLDAYRVEVRNVMRLAVASW